MVLTRRQARNCAKNDNCGKSDSDVQHKSKESSKDTDQQHRTNCTPPEMINHSRTSSFSNVKGRNEPSELNRRMYASNATRQTYHTHNKKSCDKPYHRRTTTKKSNDHISREMNETNEQSRMHRRTNVSSTSRQQNHERSELPSRDTPNPRRQPRNTLNTSNSQWVDGKDGRNDRLNMDRMRRRRTNVSNTARQQYRKGSDIPAREIPYHRRKITSNPPNYQRSERGDEVDKSKYQSRPRTPKQSNLSSNQRSSRKEGESNDDELNQIFERLSISDLPRNPRAEALLGNPKGRTKNHHKHQMKHEHLSGGIHIGTLNILDGRGSRLQLACHELERHHLDIAILTEVKLKGIHTTHSYGYDIIATKVTNQNQGGVAIISRKKKEWHLEGAERFGPNVIKTTLVHDGKRTKILGIYIPPSETDLKTIQYIDEALKNENPSSCIMIGDFNMNYWHPKDNRTTEIVDAIRSYEMKDLGTKFKPKKNKPYTWTWRKFKEGKKIQSICDYILYGKDLRWKNFKVIDVALDTDHRLIKGKLLMNARSRKYRQYIKDRKEHGMDMSTNPPTPSEEILQKLEQAIERNTNMQTNDNSWISKETFDLVRAKSKALRKNRSEEVQQLGKELRRSLRMDRRRRIWNVSVYIEERLLAGDVVGAFNRLKHWYRKFTGRVLKPSPVELEETRETYVKLFKKSSLETKMPYDFDYEGKDVDDSIPNEEEIRQALFRMRSKKAPGLSQISVDHLKDWCIEATQEDPKEDTVELWEKVVELVQRCLRDGDIPKAFFNGILVIIPKDDCGGVRGIGLLEVIHKLISKIITLRMTNAISFCEQVHGFRKKRGTFTAIGETKIRMQMATCTSETLYQVYLDLSKAYDSIDRGRVLLLLEKYKVGPRIRKYIETVWENQRFVLRQSQFYSKAVEVEKGVTQGDINSPSIFNVIIDSVLRAWMKKINYDESRSCFYADDGLLENTNPTILQQDLDSILSLFKEINLNANEKKTKYMVVRGAVAPKALKKEMYDNIDRRRRGLPTTLSFAEKKNLDVQCETCGKTMKAVSLERHMRNVHKMNLNNKYEKCAEDTIGTFVLDNFTKGIFNNCPVPGCSGGGKDTFAVYRHFCNRHPKADIVISGDRKVIKCDRCGMMCRNLEKHKETSYCKKDTAQRKNEQLRELQALANDVKFTVNNKIIEKVHKFKYLGRWLADDDDDTFSIMDNLKKARQKWNCLALILKREGANAICMARFYMVIVQAVLLYGADSWTVTERNLKRIKSFHHRAVRYMTGHHIKKVGEEWEYPNHQKLLKECKLLPIEKYIERRRGTLRKYFETSRKNLLTLAEHTKRHKYDPKKVLWWKQPWIEKTTMKVFSNMWFSTI